MCVGDVNHLNCGGVCAYRATVPKVSSALCRYEIHAMSVDVAGKFHDAVDGDPDMLVTLRPLR